MFDFRELKEVKGFVVCGTNSSVVEHRGPLQPAMFRHLAGAEGCLPCETVVC
jgi:hypothetical protein